MIVAAIGFCDSNIHYEAVLFIIALDLINKARMKNVNLILDLAANDYIEVYIFLSRSTGSVTLHVYGDSYYGTHFTGFKLA